jgi:hypothetical protein
MRNQPQPSQPHLYMDPVRSDIEEMERTRLWGPADWETLDFDFYCMSDTETATNQCQTHLGHVVMVVAPTEGGHSENQRLGMELAEQWQTDLRWARFGTMKSGDGMFLAMLPTRHIVQAIREDPRPWQERLPRGWEVRHYEPRSWPSIKKWFLLFMDGQFVTSHNAGHPQAKEWEAKDAQDWQAKDWKASSSSSSWQQAKSQDGHDSAHGWDQAKQWARDSRPNQWAHTGWASSSSGKDNWANSPNTGWEEQGQHQAKGWRRPEEAGREGGPVAKKARTEAVLPIPAPLRIQPPVLTARVPAMQPPARASADMATEPEVKEEAEEEEADAAGHEPLLVPTEAEIVEALQDDAIELAMVGQLVPAMANFQHRWPFTIQEGQEVKLPHVQLVPGCVTSLRHLGIWPQVGRPLQPWTHNEANEAACGISGDPCYVLDLRAVSGPDSEADNCLHCGQVEAMMRHPALANLLLRLRRWHATSMDKPDWGTDFSKWTIMVIDHAIGYHAATVARILQCCAAMSGHCPVFNWILLPEMAVHCEACQECSHILGHGEGEWATVQQIFNMLCTEQPLS